jgi:hypothetical protein
MTSRRRRTAAPTRVRWLLAVLHVGLGFRI